MRLYWEIAVRGFRRYASYRGATIGGLFTNTFFGFFRGYTFVALFALRPVVAGWTLEDTLTYAFLTQGLIAIVGLWGWWDIAISIRTGDVATDLYRPLDYQAYWLAQDAGRVAFHALARGLVPFVAGALAFHLRLPTDPVTWLWFVLSVALAALVAFGIRFIANVLSFWVLDHRGTAVALNVLWGVLAGFIVPIPFFPPALRAVANVLPFAATLQAPIEVFLERAGGAALAGTLAFQAAWAVALLVLGRAVLAAGFRKVVTQGG